MLDKIKYFIFKRILISASKNQKREKSFVNYNKAQNVLILFESNLTEKNREIKVIMNKLEHDNKKVTAWGFVNKKNVISPILPNYHIFNQADFNFLGQPSGNLIEKVKEMEVDLLLDLTTSQILPFQYLTHYSLASFKVGMKKGDIQPYDFMMDFSKFKHKNPSDMDPEESLEEFIEFDARFLYNQFIFYLKNIETRD